MTLVITYSRVILIAVYTHLLLLESEGQHQVYWRWLNILGTITLWGVELIIGKDEEGQDGESLLRGFRLKDD